MSALTLICERCGGKISHNVLSGKYVCESCNTEYVFKENTDFKIVAGVLKKYEGASCIVSIPEGVKEINIDAFDGLRVTEVTIPSTLEVFNTEIFNHCPDIERIIISNGVKTIHGNGCYMHRNDCKVSEVEIPESVANIIGNPFLYFGVKRLKINREFSYYFGEYGFEPFRKYSDCILGYDVIQYPWSWKSLETVITPAGEVDYKKYSKECFTRYEIAEKEYKRNKEEEICRERLLLNEKGKVQVIEKAALEPENKYTEVDDVVVKRKKALTNLSIVAFVFSMFSFVFFPIGVVSIIMAVIDLLRPSARGKQRILTLLAIIFGMIGVLRGIIILSLL